MKHFCFFVCLISVIWNVSFFLSKMHGHVHCIQLFIISFLCFVNFFVFKMYIFILLLVCNFYFVVQCSFFACTESAWFLLLTAFLFICQLCIASIISYFILYKSYSQCTWYFVGGISYSYFIEVYFTLIIPNDE